MKRLTQGWRDFVHMVGNRHSQQEIFTANAMLGDRLRQELGGSAPNGLDFAIRHEVDMIQMIHPDGLETLNNKFAEWFNEVAPEGYQYTELNGDMGFFKSNPPSKMNQEQRLSLSDDVRRVSNLMADLDFLEEDDFNAIEHLADFVRDQIKVPS